MRIGFDIEEDAAELEDIFIIPERPEVPDSPERQLFLAILESAVHEASNANRKHRFYQLVARVWIDGGDDAPVSFNTVCELVGYDPDAVRAALRKQWDV